MRAERRCPHRRGDGAAEVAVKKDLSQRFTLREMGYWLFGSIRGVSPQMFKRANIIPRRAPILALTPFSLLIVDSLAQPLKSPLPPANFVFHITINIPLDQFGPITNVSSGEVA